MKSTYSAHGKVILIGEHSVVYGYDALCLPIKSLRIKSTVEDNNKMWMDTNNYHGPFFDAPEEYNGLKYVLKTMLKKANTTKNVKITYTGQIPTERGFGSSATVALGTSKALNDYFALNLTEKEIMTITNKAEMINHGKASGLDTATVNSDDLIFFNTEIGPQKLKDKLGATLLIMDTGELGNTKKAVTQVRSLLNESISANQKIKHLGFLADDTKKAWFEKNIRQVGQDFNEAQTILASFDLSTDKIDRLQKIALDNDALGFKLSGGGLGGIVIALCSDKTIAQKIANKSQALIDNYWIEQI